MQYPTARTEPARNTLPINNIALTLNNSKRAKINFSNDSVFEVLQKPETLNQINDPMTCCNKDLHIKLFGQYIYIYYVTMPLGQKTCNGKVEKMEERSSMCAVERGGTADTMVTGVGEAAVDEGTSHCQVGQTEWYTAAWSSCRLRPKHTPSCMIVLVLSSQKMSKMENGSSSGLGLLKRPHGSWCPQRPCSYL